MDPWYASWFDSPFYPMLYRHRDEQEAAAFLDRLLQEIQLPQGSRILDLACGRGRHSRFLHSKGMIVHGVDLSPRSIGEATLLSADGLSFEVRDMRTPWTSPDFDLALSLFTSFGYFDTDEENRRVLETLRSAVHTSGFVVLDFFNSQKVLKALGEVEKEQKQIGDYSFHIHKWIDTDRVVKEIRVQSPEQDWHFSERVRAYSLEDLMALSEQADLEINQIWGGYSLEAFNPDASDRSILLMTPRL